MKIFSNTEQLPTKAPKESGLESRGIKKIKDTKPQISEREIRDKLASHVETSNSSKAKIQLQNSKQLGAGFLNEDTPRQPIEQVEKIAVLETAEETKSDKTPDAHLLKSDISLNDPRSSDTQMKLKTVLSSGGFNFNPRERETLEKILGGN